MPGMRCGSLSGSNRPSRPRPGRPPASSPALPRSQRRRGLIVRAASPVARLDASSGAAADPSSTIAAVSHAKLELPRERRVEAEPVEAHLEADRRTYVIRPARRWPHLDVRELWHYRELLLTLVWRDVIVRYKQTFLGVAWALLVPALTATVYIVVFGRFANFPHGTTPYPILVVAGVFPMQYFPT